MQNSGNPCLNSESLNNDLLIFDSIFSGNQAEIHCSCLKFYGQNLLLFNSSFINNRGVILQFFDKSDFLIFNEGGSLNLGAENMKLDKILIYNSSALKGAGVIFHNKFSKDRQNATILEVFIKNNDGVQTAGIHFDGSLTLGNYYFYNCSIKNNKVSFYAVIATFYFSNINITFDSCDISNNSGSTAGAGVAFCHYGGFWVLNKTTFFGNKLIGKNVFVGGGAILAFGVIQSTIVYIYDCEFIGNIADGRGGAIQNIYGQIYVKDSVFMENEAVFGGTVSISFHCPDGYRNVFVKGGGRFSEKGGCFYFSDEFQGR